MGEETPLPLPPLGVPGEGGDKNLWARQATSSVGVTEPSSVGATEPSLKRRSVALWTPG